MVFTNVLITGGAGFIGSQLARKILPTCKHIYIIDDLSTGQREAIPVSAKITFIQGSITNKKLLQEIVPKVEYIFHLACSNLLTSITNLKQDFQTNLYGGYILLETAHQHCPNLKRFIYTSTASIYSEAEIIPTTENYYNIKLPYAASKFAVEHYCAVYHHLYHLPVTVLRLSNVYGPGQTPANPYCGVIAKFFTAAEKNEPLIIYGDGRQSRDFTFIADALEAIILGAKKEEAIGKVYNVGTGTETAILKLAQLICQITGAEENKLEFRAKRPVDIVTRRNIDATKIQRELHWKINYSLYAGLLKTWQWLKGAEN